MLGQLCARQLVHPGPKFVQHPGANIISADPVVQHPGPSFRNIQNLGKQDVHIQNLDAFVAHCC